MIGFVNRTVLHCVNDWGPPICQPFLINRSIFCESEALTQINTLVEQVGAVIENNLIEGADRCLLSMLDIMELSLHYRQLIILLLKSEVLLLQHSLDHFNMLFEILVLAREPNSLRRGGHL